MRASNSDIETSAHSIAVTVDPSEPINVIHDHQAQTISVIAPTTLSAGHVRLRLRFRGKINDEPRGFYRVPPVPTTDGVTSEDTQNGPSRILSTRFDPRDARMVFPCFDEPHMKSTFDVEIEVPDGLTVSGNTPIKDTHDIERSGEQRKIISLERSALISTNVGCDILVGERALLIFSSYSAGA